MRRAARVTAAAAAAVVASGQLAGCSTGSSARTAPPYFGLDVPGHDPDQVDRVADLLGCAPGVTSSFVKLDSDVRAEELARRTRGGTTPFVTLEPWSWRSRPGQPEQPAYALARVADGTYDAELRRIATVLATHPTSVVVRFAHEMNAGWYPWGVGVNGNTTADYLAAWKHVRSVMDAVAPHLLWLWSPVAAWWPDAGPLQPLYPGDDQVDLVGATGYGHGGTAEETFGAWLAEVRTFTDRPAVLSETGADGPDRAGWIASLGDFLADEPSVLGFTWFNTSPGTTGATGDYRIDRGPSLQAFRRLLDDLGVDCTDGAPSTSDLRSPA